MIKAIMWHIFLNVNAVIVKVWRFSTKLKTNFSSFCHSNIEQTLLLIVPLK